MLNLNNPIFHDENKAREALEAVRWPDGPVCPHCGNSHEDRIAKIEGKKQSHRRGLYYCNECQGQFTVTVGTVFERSKIPLTKWWQAAFLINSSKKGISAHQIHRSLDVTYKTAWFMMHRIREAMTDMGRGPIGGEGKIIEADETVIGGSKYNRAYAKKAPKKHAVMSLVERGGEVRSFHVANVTAKTLRPLVVKAASRKSRFMTDEGKWYQRMGEEFASHETVNHWQDEYVRGDVYTNTAENYFSILKRGIYGVYQHVSEAHLHRYLAEFDFRHNTRAKLGVTDGERTVKALKGIEGKRLTYRPTYNPYNIPF
jgi:transposase-like protein